METDRKIINPAAGAIVMALGIFLHTSFRLLPYASVVLPFLLGTLLVITLVIVIKLCSQMLILEFRTGFINHPVNFFTMGTWVAGISVTSKVFIFYYPEVSLVVTAVMVVNTILYSYYLFYCLRHLMELWKKPDVHAPNGVLLLVTVATQSIVIVWTVLYHPFLIQVGVWFGLLLYVISATVILRSYHMTSGWTLADSWSNTNCIFHGALSISGFAMLLSGVVSEEVARFFWVIVLIVLIVIESVEVIRARHRVRKFGWRKGIFTYHISQWSRNFTFGMFFAFTIQLHQGLLVHLWGWVVIALLMVEISLFVAHRKKERPL